MDDFGGKIRTQAEPGTRRRWGGSIALVVAVTVAIVLAANWCERREEMGKKEEEKKQERSEGPPADLDPAGEAAGLYRGSAWDRTDFMMKSVVEILEKRGEEPYDLKEEARNYVVSVRKELDENCREQLTDLKRDAARWAGVVSISGERREDLRRRARAAVEAWGEKDREAIEGVISSFNCK